LRIERVRLFVTFLCEDEHASILPLKVLHLVPREGRYPELWWILLVGSNVLNVVQGLVKLSMFVYNCDGRGRTCFSLGLALGYACNLDAGLSVSPCWFHLLAFSLILFHYRIDHGSLLS